jgi:arginase family enzyme
MYILVPFSSAGNTSQAPHTILAYRNSCGKYHKQIAEVAVQPTPAKTAENIHKGLLGLSDYIVLGGDHSITLGVLRARAENEGPIHVVTFDAHSDDYIMDGADPAELDSGNWLRLAMDEGLVSGVTWFCYREFDETDDEWEMAQVAVDEIPAVGPVHVTVDIDVLKASEIMWATSFPVLEGCELVELLGDIAGLELGENEVTVDVTEYDPSQDVTQIGCKVTNHVVDELLKHLKSH